VTSAESERSFARALRARGQRVTAQRLAIRHALARLDRHASAEEVHAEVATRLSGVSMPTVYATLDLLAELGIARKVHPGEGPVLYDPRIDEHHHLACRRCGRVEDVEGAVVATEALDNARRAGFAPAQVDVVIGGLCRDCAR
jgi:Fe2+ or Zn2+ uptake regulation protein